jgi:hypothetical protein
MSSPSNGLSVAMANARSSPPRRRRAGAPIRICADSREDLDIRCRRVPEKEKFDASIQCRPSSCRRAIHPGICPTRAMRGLWARPRHRCSSDCRAWTLHLQRLRPCGDPAQESCERGARVRAVPMVPHAAPGLATAAAPRYARVCVLSRDARRARRKPVERSIRRLTNRCSRLAVKDCACCTCARIVFLNSPAAELNRQVITR